MMKWEVTHMAKGLARHSAVALRYGSGLSS
jgi:hypothetical protein